MSITGKRFYDKEIQERTIIDSIKADPEYSEENLNRYRSMYDQIDNSIEEIVLLVNNDIDLTNRPRILPPLQVVR